MIKAYYNQHHFWVFSKNIVSGQVMDIGCARRTR